MRKNHLRWVPAAAGLAAAAMMAGCGGGGGDDAPQSPSRPASACPASSINDAWLNNRLACFSPGQLVIENTFTTTSTGAPADYSFMLKQRIYDVALNNVLGGTGDMGRYFGAFVCVRNLPADGRASASLIGLSTDLLFAAGLREPTTTPAGYVSYLQIVAPGSQTSVTQETCDLAKHPVIIDFTTRRVVSVNSAALAAVAPVDAP